MTLFPMVTPKHIYRYWSKVVAKYAHQNQAINIEINPDQYLVGSIKSATQLTPG